MEENTTNKPHFRLTSLVGLDELTIIEGELSFINEATREFKTHFNGSLDYLKPTVYFEFPDSSTTIVELKRTEKGFAGILHRYGKKYGVNFNRVKNQRARWGITVWVDDLKAIEKAS